MSETEQKTRRVFFAIRLTKSMATSVAASLAPLKKDLKGSWTHPDDLHITLKFLGDVSPHLLAPLLEHGTELAARQTRFDLSLGSWNFFPRRSGPQVLWLGVNVGHLHLSQLASTFDAATHQLGFPQETRLYTAHITLARIRMRFDTLETYLQKSTLLPPNGSMQATHIELMESVQASAAGLARYACLHSMPLAT